MNLSTRVLLGVCTLICPLYGQSNETAIENANAGTASWQLSNPALNREIEGYPSVTSVNVGGSISFFVSTAAPSYTMDVYRLGWYGGTGARQMVSTVSRTGLLQTTPVADSFGRFECNWTSPFVLSIPANWVSGIYVVKLTASTGPQSYIPFVVREDARASAYLFQHSVTTDEAYNNWPGPAANGKSLYTFNSSGGVAAVKVSFNRPYFIDTDSHYATHVGAGFLLRWEVMMLRWLESQGYDVTYCTNVDNHENASLLLSHKAFLSVGHDEYWSWEMRANVEAARDQGVNIGFFSADAVYWQIRLETSPISGAADRTIVGYKETAQAGLYGSTKTNDPTTNVCLITTNWRFNSCKPSEQALIGVEFIEGSVGCPGGSACVDMVIADPTNWALAGTGLATGSHIPGILGYEVDGQLTSNSPTGTQVIAKSPIPILDADAQNHPFSEMVSYTAASGATVFAVGTFQWTWGLDDYGAPAQRPSQLSPAVQKITQNVLSRFAPAAPSAPDLTITKSHAGNFTPGQTGAKYTITVTNAGTTPTSGTVTLTDTVPAGLTASSIGGTGWTCTQPAGSCTRTDALAAGASYPVVTLTVNVAGNAPATVTNTATVAGGGETNTSNDTATDATIVGSPAAPVTDNFNTSSLNTSVWTFVNPVGDGAFSMTGTQLKLNVPAASNHDPAFGGADNSVRVVQAIANADFTVTAKFDSIPNQQYEFQGILVEQDSANYLRFQFGSSSTALFATASTILAHNETSQFSNAITLPGGTTSLWLRVQKAGNTWTESWSPNGTTFTTAGTFTQALTVADIGPFAGNYNPTTSAAPAFAALVDSFVNAAVAAVPDLTITKSHTGNFTLGQSGAIYTIIVTNSGGAATSGTVTVSDTLPTGLTAASIAGTGWTCTQPAGSCTRSDALAAAASYPALTLTVNVAANAPASVTNTATVSGGGETNTANNTASDVTTIGSSAGPPVTDNFNTSSLNTSLWTIVNPVGDGSSSMTGTQLKLTVPAGSNHDPAFGGVDNSVRAVQSIANADFTVTTKFDSIPNQQYEFEGMLVEQDTANYLRFQFGSTSTAVFATASVILSHNETSLFSNQIAIPAGTTSLWLRVQKAGNTWTESWSPDGNTFTTAGTFTQALTVADIGPFAGNYNPTTSAAPAFSALVDSFVNGAVAAVPDLTITKSHTGNFAQGQTGATYTLTVTNSGGAATSGTVTVTDTLPTGLTATSIAGTGWTCTQPGGSCTRGDALAAAASYPVLTLTVNVAANAPATVTNTATVSGGGETNTSNDTAANPTTIGAAATPDLTITKSHTGNFTLGQTGAIYTITVTNSGSAPTTGTVTVADTLPTGLTAASIAGTGWTCTQPAGSCTRSDALAAAASYPALTLTVNVAANAPASVTNTATVSGGGETNTSNDTASDVTAIGSVVGQPVTDNFNISSLNTSLWTFLNPVGDGTFSMTGTQLQLNAPAGPNHDAALNGVDSAPRVVQSVGNADFTVTVKYDSIPTQQYQFEGLVVDQDAANFLRFQFGSSGTALGVSADIVLAHNISGAFSNTITLPAGTTSLWLRVQRAANTWTVTWSPDGNTFNTGGTFSQALTVADMGPFAGNYSNTSAPAFSALVDSFVSGTAAAAPDLTISKSHTGNFTPGQTGATYSITVTNSGSAATTGTVTLADTVPAGLTATAIAGTGWTCTLATVSCTRSDALAAANSYPAITLTVTVAANAPATVTNTATVSGGGETNTSNDTASDPTTIGTAAGAPVTDNFNTSSLNTGLWTFLNPVGDGTFSMTGTQLKLTAPLGPNHDAALNGVDSAPRVVQSVANGDFIVTAKFDSIPTQQYQFQGLVVDQDAANFVRFQFGSSGTALGVSADIVLAHNISGAFSNTITLPAGTTSLWLRVQRAGNSWTVTWSPDGNTFNTGGAFSQALTVADIGVFAGNYSGTSAPAFSAIVDSFVSGAVAPAPDLTITKSHTGNFTLSQTGATYTITVRNSGNAATSGTVTVTDTVPSGLTARSISGTGWTCTPPAGSCTRSDALAATASYPALTLTVNVASNAPATVTNTATVSGGGETNMTNDTASDVTTIQGSGSGSPISDDFTSGTLNAAWTFVNPQNDGSFSLNGNSLLLNVPAGINHDEWTNGANGIGVMQAAPDTDFEIEVKFSSTLNKGTPFQQQGIIIQQDAANFLRLCMYSDNQRIIVFLASILGTSGNVIVSQETRGPQTPPGGPTWMRVKRTGSNWLYSYSYDAIHWTPFAFTQALHVTKVGPYAGNSQFNGGSAPAFTAVVDHFVNRATPPSTIDGAAYPPPAAAPVINVWYGDSQTFGQPGQAQQWVNILGDVSSFDQVTTLTYSLNGGAQQVLWMGENLFRLVAPGDFNVEIDYASLTAGSNSVTITATDTLGRQTQHTVALTIIKNQTWPSSYTADWSKVTNPQSISQVVDGPWRLQSGGVRITETGYDRLIAIGDRATWKNFVATAEVTMNSLDTFGFAVAIIAGWQGHTTLQYGVPLPDQPRTGHPFPAFGGYAMGLPGPPSIMLYQNTAAVPESVIVQDSNVSLLTGVKYIFKLQANANNSGGSHYMFKVWKATDAEPANWNLQGDGELSTGSIVLAAHRADVTFGLVTVTGL